MSKKPSDLLDFLRTTSSSEEVSASPARAEASSDLERTTRMLVLRRSQVVVASAAAGLVVVLAFLLGLAFGGDGGSGEAARAPATGVAGVWTIRVAGFGEDEAGQTRARQVVRELKAVGLGDEVHFRRVLSDREVVVTVGAWLGDPQGNSQARGLLDRIRGLRQKDGGTKPFKDARFWTVQR